MLEKTLESPLHCKEIQPVHPKGDQPWLCSLERLMLKLKLQYFGHLMRRTDSLEKTLMLGKIEGRRRRGRQGWDGWMASPTQWTWVWANCRRKWRTRKPGVLQSMGLQRVRHNFVAEQNQLQTNIMLYVSYFSIKLRKKVSFENQGDWESDWLGFKS